MHAGGSFATGVALALGAAFFYAIAAIIAKGLKGVPPHLIVLIQLLIGAALMSPSALPDQPRAWGLLVAIGVVHTGLMSTLLYSALQKTATSLIGVLSFIYPIVAMLVDALAFDQRMNAIQIAGAALILLSAAAMNRPARANGRQSRR
ncbi:DMT family transporter [Achromobacter xylosoxidans]